MDVDSVGGLSEEELETGSRSWEDDRDELDADEPRVSDHAEENGRDRGSEGGADNRRPGNHARFTQLPAHATASATSTTDSPTLKVSSLKQRESVCVCVYMCVCVRER